MPSTSLAVEIDALDKTVPAEKEASNGVTQPEPVENEDKSENGSDPGDNDEENNGNKVYIVKLLFKASITKIPIMLALKFMLSKATIM